MKISDLEYREFSKYRGLYDFSGEIRGKTFLITGSKGIVGSGIIKWLLLENRKSHADLHIIASTRNPDEKPEYLEKDDPVTFCAFGSEPDFCRDWKIDYIIHAAASTDNSFHNSHPVESLLVILEGTEKALDIARRNPDCKLIYLSSEEVYGIPDTEEPLLETRVAPIDSLNRRSCYPLGKKTSELLCYSYFAEYGVQAKIIRPTGILGLLQKYQTERVASEILRCIVENRNLVLKSAGLTKKCVLYSLDAIAAVFTVLFYGEPGEAYNATNPRSFMTVRDLAERMFGIFRPNLSIEYQESDTSIQEGYLPMRSLLQSNEKIAALGWRPMTDLDHIYKIDLLRFASSEIR